MDDMVFQYNNQNSIYVLNSSYNSYGDFGRLNLIACPQLGPLASDDHNQGCQTQTMSSVSRSLQHKLRTLGSCSSRHPSVAPSTSSAASASFSSGGGGSSSCSPAAAAIQKLFNCTSLGVANNSANNNNNMNGCGHDIVANNNVIIRDCLSTTETDGAGVDAGGNISSSNNVSNSSALSNSSNNSNNNKKKSTTVKSTLIAKKTKFWKYLEEERQRTQENLENLPTSNCERNRDRANCFPNSSPAQFVLRGNSSANDSIPTTPDGFAAGCRKLSTEMATTLQQQQEEHQQHEEEEQLHQQQKSNNWSGNHDSNNQKQPKTSSELYKEAAELLGLSCTLCDNCRCLDCQSGYFDCDDSDSYSEFSLVDEDDECPLVMATTTRTTTTTANTTTTTAPADTTSTSSYLMHEDFGPEEEDDDEEGEDDDDHRHRFHCGPQCSEANCNSVDVSGGVDCAGDVAATTKATATTTIERRSNEIAADVRRISGDDKNGVDSHGGIGSITTQPLLSTSMPRGPTEAARRWLHELERGPRSFNELSLVDGDRRPASNHAHQ